jgi:hypothetical protein
MGVQGALFLGYQIELHPHLSDGKKVHALQATNQMYSQEGNDPRHIRFEEGEEG